MLNVGDVIKVSLGLVDSLHATVKWKKDEMVGVEFHTALDLAIVDYFAAYCGMVA